MSELLAQLDMQQERVAARLPELPPEQLVAMPQMELIQRPALGIENTDLRARQGICQAVEFEIEGAYHPP